MPPALAYHSYVQMPKNSANAFFPAFVLKSVWKLIGNFASNAFICFRGGTVGKRILANVLDSQEDQLSLTGSREREEITA